MKQYVIDDLRPWEYEKIKSYAQDHFLASDVDGIYWITLPPECLNQTQRDHAQCQPHCFALELEPGRLSFELLVRTRERMRCDCMGYASERQRNWLVRLADGILEHLGIDS